jgi:putative addiction module component (TIGR02574 family)
MTVDIDTLLALPKSERRKIAEKLWDSLAPTYNVSKEDEATMVLLEERWQNIQSGKSVLYSGDELKNMVVEHRKKK